MPIRTRAVPGTSIVLSVARDRLTGEELRGYEIPKVLGSAVNPPLVLLFDARRVTAFETDGFDLKFRAESPRNPVSRFVRVAVLAGNDLGFGLARMFQVYADRRYGEARFGVFREKTKAVRWLLGL